jgi:hypothetical protein
VENPENKENTINLINPENSKKINPEKTENKRMNE